jgi:hypothetical protein
MLSPENAEIARAYRGLRFENVVALGNPGPYYISHMAVIPSAKRSYARGQRR